jgi:hypothetical protein
LLPTLGWVVLLSACGSEPPISPTGIQQNSSTGSGGPGGAAGPAVLPATSISAGSVVESTVDGRDPDCFPAWDASGHCRQYAFTAPSDGTLVAHLTFSGSPGRFDPDLFLVAPDGEWVYAPDKSADRLATLHVKAGLTYHIVVFGYGTLEQTFTLSVDLQP